MGGSIPTENTLRYVVVTFTSRRKMLHFTREIILNPSDIYTLWIQDKYIFY